MDGGSKSSSVISRVGILPNMSLSVVLPCCPEEQQLHSSKAGPEDGLHNPIENVPKLCMPLNDYTFCCTTLLV
jgi:hypothetical protein